MPILIKNGDIVTAERRFAADVLCEGEKITAIAPNLSAPQSAEIIDAAGKLIFPGFIDPHVHIYLPFMGTFAKDTWETASRAALIGGTTTLIEMICPDRTRRAAGRFRPVAVQAPKAVQPATTRSTWASRGSTPARNRSCAKS